MKDKTTMNEKKGKPSFVEKNQIWPADEAKGKNSSMEASMFSKEALSSDIPPDGRFAKKGKGGTVDKSVFAHKDNMMSPDANY